VQEDGWSYSNSVTIEKQLKKIWQTFWKYKNQNQDGCLQEKIAYERSREICKEKRVKQQA